MAGTQAITEKDKTIIDEWYKEASKQTIETLPQFMSHVLGDYEHDYGTIVKAIGACAIAAAWAGNSHPNGGITGFQAGAVMWEFIRHWNHDNNKCGMRLVDYDNMLYPQYENRFNKTISPQVMGNLANEAEKRLSEDDMVHPEVKAHWEKIAKGIPPFGYRISNEARF